MVKRCVFELLLQRGTDQAFVVDSTKYIIGTSGFSFPDWVENFYPAGTPSNRMFDYYVRQFSVVELNFTFYAMPGARTFDSLLSRSPQGFEFWVKVNKQVTHERKLPVAREFALAVEPLRAANKLAGLLLQFPQSFKRTIENRKFVDAAIKSFQDARLAVEFRDSSWEHPATIEGLRSSGVCLVVPDAPAVTGLFHPPPMATSRIAYLRLHSRNADNWYKGEKDRYDYNYSTAQLQSILQQWSQVEAQVDKVYTMFNNCSRGQAAQNAQEFRRMLGQIG